MFQTGTTSGRIRFTLSGISTDGDPTTLLTIPAAAISLDTATATRRTGNLDIQLIGFDNTYSAGAMTFTFFDTSGQTLPPGAIHADFTQDFRSVLHQGASRQRVPGAGEFSGHRRHIGDRQRGRAVEQFRGHQDATSDFPVTATLKR